MAEKRTSRLIVRTTPEELADWEAQAKALSLTLAELVRMRMRRPEANETALPVPPSRGSTKLAAKARQVGKVLRAAAPKASLEAVVSASPLGPVLTGAVEAKPLTDAEREYRRKLLVGAINPGKGKKA